MLITRTKIIATTVIATLLYILLSYAVGPEPFFEPLFAGADWTGAENDAGEKRAERVGHAKEFRGPVCQSECERQHAEREELA